MQGPLDEMLLRPCDTEETSPQQCWEPPVPYYVVVGACRNENKTMGCQESNPSKVAVKHVP